MPSATNALLEIETAPIQITSKKQAPPTSMSDEIKGDAQTFDRYEYKTVDPQAGLLSEEINSRQAV